MALDPDLSGLAVIQAPEPSTLYLFWADPEPPLEEEIRLALQHAWPGVSWAEALEVGGGVLWGSAWRFAEHDAEVLIWAEDRGTELDDFLNVGALDEASLGQARASRWVLGVETILDGEAAQTGFQFQLRALCSLALPGLPAVHDGNAHVIRSGRSVRELAEAAAAPRASTLYAIHSSAGLGGVWLHTHGLDRAGLPELEMVGVPADDLGEGYDLVDAVVDALLGECTPDETGRISVGEGLSVRLLALDEALAVLPEAHAGGRIDRESRRACQDGNRRVIFDAELNSPPLRVLGRLAAGGVLFKSSAETERLSALSRERWGTFGLLFALHREDPWRFHVKMGWPRAQERCDREHLWLEVLELRPGKVCGRLLSEPADGGGLSSGDVVWRSLEHLTDWVVVTPDGTFDPEDAASLLIEK
jgi:hypothetical protein